MLPVGANLQRIKNGKKTYAITPHIPGGFITADRLEKYAQVARLYHGVLKLTSAQRIMITNLQAEDIQDIWAQLEMEPAIGFANCVRSVKICPGTAFCKRAKKDSVKIGLALDKAYIKKEMPSRMKMGVSGCPNSCSESVVKDIGLIGTEQGWDLYVGGSAGSHPRLANQLIGGLSDEVALSVIEYVIGYYQTNAEIERLGQFIDRIGFEHFKTEVLKHYENNRPFHAEKKHGEEQAFAPLPGGLTEGTLAPGDEITADSVIADIIRVYPKTIPVLRSFGLGCLGCPSAAGESIHQAAEIHGLVLDELIPTLNEKR
ncbi:DUF1858 domain-containing protein [Anaerosinus massiliensis]|uniref:DUF1858 domain-containing protein n=1 Tax=Massilibacillus massiliensis TaxID=1806837 RepID=UPI000A98FAEB|nr:DUF1858 domain-containing protein [Massilibacillus massiliensis]